LHQQNIRDMFGSVENNRGFDVVVIVSSSKDQAEFWRHRLRATKGLVIADKTRIISVEEDWSGGAGQLLGTLYAWKKTRETLDLDSVLLGGGSVAMYHTAGKGTRMAPLPAAEANNKSAIKLPRLINVAGRKTFLTVLEAVIFQTGIFAASRPGRLCVFWGDQVFIPSKAPDFSGVHHAELLDIRSEIPSDESSWKKDWQCYGLVIPSANGEALQREKQKWEELQALINGGTARPDASGKMVLGKSLGCFSISRAMLAALLEEFASELVEKQCKLDTDPHLWMPLTSTRSDFGMRGGDPAHWDRINRFKERFLYENPGFKLFGDKDIGAGTLWWDYGQAWLYHQNIMKSLENSFEGKRLRQFYNLDDHWIKSSDSDGAVIENSLVIASKAKGKIRNSVLMGASVDGVNMADSLAISSTLSQVQASRSLIYNCVDLANLELTSGTVVADIRVPSRGRVRMMTRLERDGKEDWETVLPGNSFSFKALSEWVTEQLGRSGQA
jgi:hypothetical protein